MTTTPDIIAKLAEALEIARNGLQWYHDTYPHQVAECDHDAMEEIDAGLAAYRQHTEAAPSTSPAAAAVAGPRLDAEARVGHTTFGIGVPERLVVDAAKRAATHPQGLVDEEAKRAFQQLIADNAARAAFLDSHPGVSKELADLIEDNERLRDALAAAPSASPAEAEEDGIQFIADFANALRAADEWTAHPQPVAPAGQAAAGVQGEASIVAPERSARDMRRLTALWRFGKKVLPLAAVSFDSWLRQLDMLIDSETYGLPMDGVPSIHPAPAPAVERGVEDAAFKACMEIADDLRNHEVVRMTAAKCALAVRAAISTAGKEQA